MKSNNNALTPFKIKSINIYRSLLQFYSYTEITSILSGREMVGGEGNNYTHRTFITIFSKLEV